MQRALPVLEQVGCLHRDRKKSQLEGILDHCHHCRNVSVEVVVPVEVYSGILAFDMVDLAAVSDPDGSRSYHSLSSIERRSWVPPVKSFSSTAHLYRILHPLLEPLPIAFFDKSDHLTVCDAHRRHLHETMALADFWTVVVGRRNLYHRRSAVTVFSVLAELSGPPGIRDVVVVNNLHVQILLNLHCMDIRGLSGRMYRTIVVVQARSLLCVEQDDKMFHSRPESLDESSVVVVDQAEAPEPAWEEYLAGYGLAQRFSVTVKCEDE